MSEDQLAQLFRYMTERFDTLEAQLAKKADKDEVLTRLDGIIARLDADDTERAALQHQVNRHEGWIQRLAEKTGAALG